MQLFLQAWKHRTIARSLAPPALSDTLSKAQMDEIRLKGDEGELKEPKVVEKLSERDHSLCRFNGELDRGMYSHTQVQPHHCCS